jgi:RTX calcium-binding nonapeptide repeat (4 copies)
MNRSVSILEIVFAVTVLVITTAAVAFAAKEDGSSEVDPQDGHKCLINHKGHHEIWVDYHAMKAHLAHGDAYIVEGKQPSVCDEEVARLLGDTEAASLLGTTGETTGGTTGGTTGATAVSTTDGTTVGTTGATTLETTASEAEESGGTTTTNAATRVRNLPEDTGSAEDVTDIESAEQSYNTTVGTDGNDDLYGNSADNKLLGLHGHDNLEAGQGADRVIGGTGPDYINAADGKPGNDVINCGIGTDYGVGDVGDDFRNCDGNVVRVGVPHG